ncbi:fibroin heavy chain-like isoform X2 [Amphibalanus amphitrite]|uniref:fibroin heavy chain-like isoform X2 n=1 Tax=Amphibalanus amphitrite TaxID=1232801 RepID=UPI001C908068|nr:fibroin heavy chain-like isoform X2 [Amphibalanus amphitrite]XP_043205698.1 fibroin heavy chain-like isoform X2 [Amphibalanus amphitrite]XP_043205699.1 fibroin heavy chain-like isoform X2 [Amphibalanus amphitrite]XP_043205700.1 fibroin heavy chain-like isoform X2 [Amphibalanus amphitrite]
MDSKPSSQAHQGQGTTPNNGSQQTASNQKANLHCEVCAKDFNRTIELNSHLAGAKHAKAVKSRQILSDLKEKIPAATGINSMFRCAPCDITLNSSQQLAMHLSGSRHKMNEKTKRCGSAIVLADRQPVAVGVGAGSQPSAAAGPIVATSAKAAAAAPSASASAIGATRAAGATTPAPSASAPAAGATAPAARATTPASGATAVSRTTPAAGTAGTGAAAKPKTAADSKPAKPPVQTFKCVACNVDLNSESQRDQHMNSKKHANKIAGNKVSHSRGFGEGFRGRGTPYSTRDRGGRGRGRGTSGGPGGGFTSGGLLKSAGYTSGGYNSGGYNSGGYTSGGAGTASASFGASSLKLGGGYTNSGLTGGSLNSVSLSSDLSTSNSGFTTGGLSGGGLARGIGRGRASWLGKGGGTDWIGNGGGYTPASGVDPGYSGAALGSSGGYSGAAAGHSASAAAGYSASAGNYSGAAAGYSGAAAGYSASAGLEMGDQGDFNMPEAGQFSNATYHNASGGGGGDYSSPVGPVFRGRGGQAHAALPYSRPPPPLPTQPPPQQPPPPPPVFQ